MWYLCLLSATGAGHAYVVIVRLEPCFLSCRLPLGLIDQSDGEFIPRIPIRLGQFREK